MTPHQAWPHSQASQAGVLTAWRFLLQLCTNLKLSRTWTENSKICPWVIQFPRPLVLEFDNHHAFVDIND